MFRRNFLALLSVLLPASLVRAAPAPPNKSGLVFRGQRVTVYRRNGYEFTVLGIAGSYHWYVYADKGGKIAGPQLFHDPDGRKKAEEYAAICHVEMRQIDPGSGVAITELPVLRTWM